MYICTHTHTTTIQCTYVHTHTQLLYNVHMYIYTPEFLIHSESWAKLTQQWLVCVPLRIHTEPINKELMLLVTI